MKRVQSIIAFVAIAITVIYFRKPTAPQYHNQKPVKRERTFIDRTPPPEVQKGLKIVSKTVPAQAATVTPSKTQTVYNVFESLAEQNVLAVKNEGDLAVTQGDIVLGKAFEGKGMQYLDAQIIPLELWAGEIPYSIQDIPNKAEVEAAIKYLNQETSLKFVPFSGQKNSIVFMAHPQNCYSYLGKQGGHQPIFLSDKCDRQAVIHEILHAVGFIHEHSRIDRDDYIEILWDNIEESHKDQFAKLPSRFSDFIRNFEYDYESIMHYRPNAFSRNQKRTLNSKTNSDIVPVTKGLSPLDIQKIEQLYP